MNSKSATAINTTPASYSFVTLSTRVHGDHARIVHEAADKAGSKSTAEWLRDRLLILAASELGIEPPDLSVYGSADLVKEAAARVGLSPAEFARRAARELAARTLGSEISGLRKATGTRR